MPARLAWSAAADSERVAACAPAPRGHASCDKSASDSDPNQGTGENPGPRKQARFFHRNGQHVDGEPREPEHRHGKNHEDDTRDFLRLHTLFLEANCSNGQDDETDGHEARNDGRADEADGQMVVTIIAPDVGFARIQTGVRPRGQQGERG